jgi:hypothetical protein
MKLLSKEERHKLCLERKYAQARAGGLAEGVLECKRCHTEVATVFREAPCACAIPLCAACESPSGPGREKWVSGAEWAEELGRLHSHLVEEAEAYGRIDAYGVEGCSDCYCGGYPEGIEQARVQRIAWEEELETQAREPGISVTFPIGYVPRVARGPGFLSGALIDGKRWERRWDRMWSCEPHPREPLP